MEQFIQETALANGYATIKLAKGTRIYQGMFFNMFKILKINQKFTKR